MQAGLSEETTIWAPGFLGRNSERGREFRMRRQGATATGPDRGRPGTPPGREEPQQHEDESNESIDGNPRLDAEGFAGYDDPTYSDGSKPL